MWFSAWNHSFSASKQVLRKPWDYYHWLQIESNHSNAHSMAKQKQWSSNGRMALWKNSSPPNTARNSLPNAWQSNHQVLKDQPAHLSQWRPAGPRHHKKEWATTSFILLRVSKTAIRNIGYMRKASDAAGFQASKYCFGTGKWFMTPLKLGGSSHLVSG